VSLERRRILTKLTGMVRKIGNWENCHRDGLGKKADKVQGKKG
jgi:hypothetical protein